MIKRIFLTLICFLCFGCSSTTDSKPKILVTIPPYAGFVKSLTDNQVDVEIFVLPGSNPHTFEPSPDQIKHFTQAKVWFRTGDPVETKMARFLKQRNVEIIDLSAGLAVLSEAPHTHHNNPHEGKDLHLWLNPNIVSEQVDVMAAVLAQQFPEIAPMIKKNCIQLKARLGDLDADISARLSPFQGQFLLVSHPALGYYCQRYGLNQLSVEIEGKDPLPQDIAHLMSELKTHPVPVILIEPQYNNKGAILIADKLHIPYEAIDPYAEDYFGMLKHLTDIIVRYYGHST